MIRRLGVVDQSPIPAGQSPASALHNSIDLAQRCEDFGYSRYWVAEHHSSGGLSGAAPEILISQIASATSSIRVGSGGVMLTHYSSYKVAEQFRTLEAFHPDRIDLGLGRAPGSDRTTAAALAKGPGALGPEHYPAQIRELWDYLHDAPDPSGPFAHVRATPQVDTCPEIWLLASTEGSASIAAHFGMPMSFAHFITLEDGGAIARAYRDQYNPSAAFPEPKVNVAAAVICAETDDEADRLASSLRAWRTRGLEGAIPTVDDAMAYEAKRQFAVTALPARKPLICGSPETVAGQLEQLADEYETDEVLLVTIVHDHEARVRSHELIAGQFALEPAAPLAVSDIPGSPRETITAASQNAPDPITIYTRSINA